MEWQHRIFQISLFHYHQICTIRFIDKCLIVVTSTRGLRIPSPWNAFRPQEEEEKTKTKEQKQMQKQKQTKK